MAALTPGLFGKLPAHGDFVRRGWADDMIERLDDWLATGLAALREGWGEAALPDRMHAAPAWAGLLPVGVAGTAALYLALAPSVDRAGRFFFLAAGVAGADAAVAGAAASPSFAHALDAAMYEAMAGALDADGMVDRLAMAHDPAPPPAVGAAAAALSAWWPLGTAAGEVPALTAATLDTSLLRRLMQGAAA